MYRGFPRVGRPLRMILHADLQIPEHARIVHASKLKMTVTGNLLLGCRPRHKIAAHSRISRGLFYFLICPISRHAQECKTSRTRVRPLEIRLWAAILCRGRHPNIKFPVTVIIIFHACTLRACSGICRSACRIIRSGRPTRGNPL